MLTALAYAGLILIARPQLDCPAIARASTAQADECTAVDPDDYPMMEYQNVEDVLPSTSWAQDA